MFSRFKVISLVPALNRLGRLIESIAGDWWLNINTRSWRFINPHCTLYADTVDYETTTHSAIMKVVRIVKPTNNDLVFDLGCGKGRAICHFARLPVRKVVGIEISEK